MNKEKVDTVINSVVFTIEKLLLFVPRTNYLVDAYLNFLSFLIRNYKVYDKVDIYLNFLLHYNKYSVKKLKKIIRWVLSSVLPEVDDFYLKSRLYYCVSKSFFYLKEYNKAQNFAIKSLKYFYNVFDKDSLMHFLYYFELNLLIAKLAFYRGKYVMSYNLLQHVISKVLNSNLDGILENNSIYLLLEFFLWLVVSYLYINKENPNLENLKEILDYFIEIVINFNVYIDTEKVRDYVLTILLKNINRLFLESRVKVRKRKRREFKELIKILSGFYERLEDIPNMGKILSSLYKDYILNFIIYYPDNYRLASRFVFKSIYLNYKYIRSNNLIALSKFLLFKIMKMQKIYTDLVDYMKTVDVKEYIMNNSEISEEVEEDIMKKRMVYYS